jgi:hypothetical protein
MPGDYVALAAVVAVFAALLGVIYKLSDFIIKLRDPEIEHVKTEFHSSVIVHRLAEQNRDAE